MENTEHMILKILLTLIFSSTLIIIVLKIFSSAFLPLKMNRISKFVNSKTQYSGEKATFKECLGIALGALGFRLFIYLISCIIIIYLLDNGEIFNFKTFLQEWEKWDATNYIRIADGWYTGHVENGDYTTLAFFPLYPILMRIVDLLVKNMQLSGLIVSTLCFSIACPFLYALVALDYGKSAAKKVVVLLTVFPFSFFFGSMMSESTFLMMTVITLYFIRTHKWGLVALFGALSGLSRLAGAIIIIPAFIEWFEYYKPLELIRRKKWKCFWNVVCTKGLVILLVLAGTLGYLYINYSIAGKPFAFMEY